MRPIAVSGVRPRILPTPKPVSRTSPSTEMSTFSGLRLRWMMGVALPCSSPGRVRVRERRRRCARRCRRRPRRRASGASRRGASTSSPRVVPSTCSSARTSLPRCSKKSNTRTIAGWFSRAQMAASRASSSAYDASPSEVSGMSLSSHSRWKPMRPVRPRQVHLGRPRAGQAPDDLVRPDGLGYRAPPGTSGRIISGPEPDARKSCGGRWRPPRRAQGVPGWIDGRGVEIEARRWARAP